MASSDSQTQLRLLSTKDAAKSAVGVGQNGLLSVSRTTSDSSASLTDGTFTPESESGGELVATSTVTTEFSRRKPKQASAAQMYGIEGAVGTDGLRRSQTTKITHVGANDLQHQVDKDGALHLKPQQSANSRRRGKKVRAVVSFMPRHSRLDRFNEQAAKDP